MWDHKCPEERIQKSDMLLSLLLSELCSHFMHLTLQGVKKKTQTTLVYLFNTSKFLVS